MVLTDVSSSATALSIAVTSTGNVDLSGWTGLGWTSGTDLLSVTGSGTIKGSSTLSTSVTGGSSVDTITTGAAASTVVGAASDDIITLGAANAAVDRIVLADTSATNGSDSITNFVANSDVIAIKAGVGVYTTGNNAGGGAGAATNVFTKAGTGVNAANEVIILDQTTYLTALLAETALDAYAAATITATNDVLFVYSNGTNAFVYRDINAGTDSAGTDLTLLATLVGYNTTTAVTALTAADFLFVV